MASDLKGLFEEAALAMFDIIGQLATISAGPAAVVINKHGLTVRQRADSLEELFINWLNELLSLSATKELIFTDFIIHKLDENSLNADAFGEDMKSYEIKTEIKAATYHDLRIKKTDTGWQVEVIFDV
jgi:SHS2 domain-containing protein